MTYYKLLSGNGFLAKSKETKAYRAPDGGWIRTDTALDNEKLVRTTAKVANAGAIKTLAQELKDGTL